MKRILMMLLLSFCVSVSYADGTLDGAIGGAYGTAITTDSTNDLAVGTFDNLDFTALYAYEDTSDVFIALQVVGDINATNWGKYVFYIETDNPTSGTAGVGDGNGWARPVDADDSAGIMPSFFVGSWVDSGGGAELYQWSGSAWINLGSGISIAIGAGTPSTVEYQISKAALGNPATIAVTAWSTGGGGGDSAIDVIPPGLQASDWGVAVALDSQTVPIAVPVELGSFELQ